MFKQESIENPGLVNKEDAPSARIPVFIAGIFSGIHILPFLPSFFLNLFRFDFVSQKRSVAPATALPFSPSALQDANYRSLSGKFTPTFLECSVFWTTRIAIALAADGWVDVYAEIRNRIPLAGPSGSSGRPITAGSSRCAVSPVTGYIGNPQDLCNALKG